MECGLMQQMRAGCTADLSREVEESQFLSASLPSHKQLSGSRGI
jgi:hypothetical protein